jgi:hypothetical protein
MGVGDVPPCADRFVDSLSGNHDASQLEKGVVEIINSSLAFLRATKHGV